MAQNQQLDGQQLDTLELPYNRIASELSSEPRLVRGENAMVTAGGKLIKRLGTLLESNSSLAKRIDRWWVYETLDSPPQVYMLASVFDTATSRWQLYYNRLDGGSPGWATAGSYRDLNASQYPHEVVMGRGLAFVKSFPAASSSEKLGTVIFDGTAGTVSVKPWGALGPTTPAALVGAVTRLNGSVSASATNFVVHSSTGFPAPPFTAQFDYEQVSVTAVAHPNWTVTRAANGTTAAIHDDDTTGLWRNWIASDHIVDVNLGWKYSYAYKSITGHVTNRAPLETNPDKLPSLSGPFFDLIPKFTVQGLADTTNFPTIVIYRSNDGGGTFFTLEEIANTGAGAITYSDDSYESGSAGGTFADPVPDTELTEVAPDLTSNSPPPTVNAPLVVGTDTVAPSAPPVYFAGRIWIGIGNVLHYSANEELNIGVPEEAFPSGLKGNFFRFQYPIINLAATKDILYVFTLQATYRITGSNRVTFNPRQFLENVGAPYGHPRSVIKFGEKIAFLTQDFRVGLIENERFRPISDPLFTDIIDAVNATAEIDLDYWSDLQHDYLIVAAHRAGATSQSRQWFYDLKKSEKLQTDFWLPPWTIQATAMLSARLHENTGQKRLAFWVWDGSNGVVVRLDPTARTGTDYLVSGAAGFTFNAETHLFQVPPGNHVNTLRRAGLTPVIYDIRFDRTLFNGDDDPQVYYYLDDFWSDPISAPLSEDPARRNLSKAYKTQLFGVWNVGQRIAVKITKVLSTDLFELQNLAITWAPESGA